MCIYSFIFLEQFSVHSTAEQKSTELPCTCCPHTHSLPHCSRPLRVCICSPLVSRHRHVVITQSPQLAAGLTLCTVHSVGLG